MVEDTSKAISLRSKLCCRKSTNFEIHCTSCSWNEKDNSTATIQRGAPVQSMQLLFYDL